MARPLAVALREAFDGVVQALGYRRSKDWDSGAPTYVGAAKRKPQRRKRRKPPVSATSPFAVLGDLKRKSS